MQLELDKMLAKIKASQWALADIDWDAPGRELVTQNAELYPRLKAFMADLMWIEHVGARGFAAMARKAPTEELREIYRYFHAEEQKHANAEMALMKINADEARHLGVDFHVLEMLGHGPLYRQTLEFVARMLDPRLLIGIASYLPLLNKMRDNLVELGLKEEKLYTAVQKYERIGGTPGGRRNPWFRLISRQGRWVIDRTNRTYHVPVDALVRLTAKIPSRALPPVPTWVRQLTWKPAA
jgi:hypothetical protein